MSKKAKKHNLEVVENNDVEIREETEEMEEKKGFVAGVKEFGKKVPKPVKIVAGAVAGLAIVGGVAWKLLSNSGDGYIDADPDVDSEIEIEDLDVSDVPDAE